MFSPVYKRNLIVEKLRKKEYNSHDYLKEVSHIYIRVIVKRKQWNKMKDE